MADDSAPLDFMPEVLSGHADHIIEQYFSRLTGDPIIGPYASLETIAAELPIPAVGKIAVIGGGVSGLRVAMKVGKKYHVDVFEATDRVGGRLFTYNKFKKAKEYDYFDVGAMRFPHTATMAPTFDLFDELDIKTGEYKMQTDETWRFYNNIRRRYSDINGTTFDFDASVRKGGNVPNEWADIGCDELMNLVFRRFSDGLKSKDEKIRRKWYDELMGHDKHSTRSFMAFEKLDKLILPSGKVYPEKPLYPTTVINWLETMSFSVGWFDRAFVETVLELVAFADGDTDVKWKYVKGGSQEIAKAMKTKLESEYGNKFKLYSNFQVTGVTYDQNEASDSPMTVSGTYGSNGEIKDFAGYTHVVLAVSPQCMRYIDLSTCKLDYGQRSSILMLQPGPSTKVGIKFKSNWWGRPGQDIKGGQSMTDRTVRTIVYPSYGNGESTVLIASYCWTQDAATMGALMQDEGSHDRERLKLALLKDIAEVHGISFDEIKAEFDDWFPFDWAHNPKTMGAYAFFGPGQFSSLFQNLARSAADHRLHFAGEAISTCHAWVAGALESADRVVNAMLPTTLLSDGVEGPLPHGAGDDAPEVVRDTVVLMKGESILKQMAISYLLQKQPR